MKNYTIFNYDYLFGDHFATVSDQAKLLYVKMNFFANNGFVSNPKSILDSLGYDKGCLTELISIGEILTMPNRAEVFITAYFVHNKALKTSSWTFTTYAPYWKGKLWIKENRIATLKEKTNKDVEQANDENTEKVEKPKPPVKEQPVEIELPPIDDDQLKIPAIWTAKEVSVGARLYNDKKQGRELDYKEEQFLAAFMESGIPKVDEKESQPVMEDDPYNIVDDELAF